MAVQLKGQSGWDAKAKVARQAEADELYRVHKLRPDDKIRVPPPPGRTNKVEGRPMSVAPDGSVTCSVGGKVRSVRPESIDVQMRGPRGALHWVPLIPQEDG